jgi:putative hydrolase of HD superfamily
MREKAPMPVDLLDAGNATPLIETWYEVIQLKHLFRQGWIQRGISADNCETVAEHTFGNAMLCLMLGSRFPELNMLRVLQMALIHDVGEAYVGDITPTDKIAPETKKSLEAEAMEKIFGKLPGGRDLIGIWQEYEAQESAEAKFVKQIDRLEFAFQASVYEHQDRIDGSDFYESVARQLKDETLQAELSALRELITTKSKEDAPS